MGIEDGGWKIEVGGWRIGHGLNPSGFSELPTPRGYFNIDVNLCAFKATVFKKLFCLHQKQAFHFN